MKPSQPTIIVERERTAPDHATRNALIVGGSVAGAAAGLGGLAAYGISRQNKILKQLVIKNRREGFRAAQKAVAAAAKVPTVKATDPYHEALVNQLGKATQSGRVHMPSTHSDYAQHIKSGLAKVHAPIDELGDWTAAHGEKEAAKLAHGVRLKRVSSFVDDVANKAAARKAEVGAWQRHQETVVKPWFHSTPTAKSVDDFPDKEHYVYHVESSPGVVGKTKGPPKHHIVDTRNPEYAHLKKITPIGFNRLMKLIELDINIKEKRSSDGTFSTGDIPTDPAVMQYAYHAPLVNPSGQNFGGNDAARGRGRPPGSLNRRTVETRQAQQVYEDSVAQQPEVKSHLLRNTAIAAGGLALAGATSGLLPKVLKPLGRAQSESKFVSRISQRIGKPLKESFDVVANNPGAPNTTFRKAVSPETGQVVKRSKIFGERQVTKAKEQGLTFEESIRDRLRNFRSARDTRLEQADEWAKKHPNAAAGANPHAPGRDPTTGVSQYPVPKEDKAVVAAKGELKIVQADNRTLQAQNTSIASKKDRERLEGELRNLKGEHKKLGSVNSANVEQKAGLTAKIDDLEKKLGGAVTEPSHREQVRKAGSLLRAKGPENLAEGVIRTDELPAKVAGKLTRTPAPKQSELFVTANATSESNQFPLAGGGVANTSGAGPGVIERLKQEFKNTHGAEIAQTIKESKQNSPFPLTEDQVAEAMAHRRVKGQFNRYAPSPNEPPAGASTQDIAARDTLKDSIKQNLIKGDVETGKKTGEFLTSVESKVRDRFDAQNGIKLGKVKDADGKYTKAIPEDVRKRRSEAIKKATDRASKGRIRQLVSEGKLPKSYLKQIEPGYSASGKELAFARRVLHRIEMQRPLPPLVEFSSFVRDIAVKHLPGTVQKDIARFVKVKPGTMVSHYSMVADELIGKADPHNLSSAMANVEKRMSQKAARSEVHARRETKPILVMNDRVIDGHHFIGKAIHGKMSSSLHVIDLTPARFQLEALRPGMIELQIGQAPTRLTPGTPA